MNTSTDLVDKKRGYKFLLFIVAVAILFLIGFNLLSDWLNEAHNVNPAMVNIANMLVPLLTAVFCGAYLLLFRRGGWMTLLGVGLLAAPLACFALLQPVLGGDAQVVRWDYRFAKPSNIADAPSGESVLPGDAVERIDLTTTTPFDFPRYLGSDGNATVSSVSLAPWDTALKPLWKQAVGKGWSGFSAVNGYAITQEQLGAMECVTCYKAETGEQVWRYSAARRHEDKMAMGKPGPRATPTIYQGRVYAMSATGVLDCLDGADGSLIWSVDVPALVGIGQKTSTNSVGLEYTEEDSNMAWGRSTSPLIYKDTVIVPAGGLPKDHPDFDVEKSATMIAFNAETGELVWRGGNRMVAYGSPSLQTVLGQDQILLVAEDHAVGHDAETGEELWHFSRPGGSNSSANCSQITWLASDKLLFSKGYSAGGETVQIALDAATQKWSATSIAKDPRVLKTKMTNPVAYQNHLYSLSDGYLECVQIDGLKRKWKRKMKRGKRFGNGQLLLVGDKLLIQSESGSVHLVQANSDEFEELCFFESIKGLCWNTLCLHNDLLLVRSDLEAACYRLPLLQSN